MESEQEVDMEEQREIITSQIKGFFLSECSCTCLRTVPEAGSEIQFLMLPSYRLNPVQCMRSSEHGALKFRIL